MINLVKGKKTLAYIQTAVTISLLIYVYSNIELTEAFFSVLMESNFLIIMSLLVFHVLIKHYRSKLSHHYFDLPPLYLSLYVKSFFFSMITPARIGELLRIYDMKRIHNVSHKDAFRPFIVEKIVDLLTVILLYYALYLVKLELLIMISLFGIIIYMIKNNKSYASKKIDTVVLFIFLTIFANGIYFYSFLILTMDGVSILEDINNFQLIIISSLIAILPISISGIGVREMGIMYMANKGVGDSLITIAPTVVLVYNVISVGCLFLLLRMIRGNKYGR